MSAERRRRTDVPENRKNPLWFEKDGDFNPGWFLFVAFAILGVLASIGAIVVALLSPEKAWPAAIGALSFIAFGMLCTAFIVVPIARAKLLAPALKASAGSIAKVAAPLDFEPQEWATGDPDEGVV